MQPSAIGLPDHGEGGKTQPQQDCSDGRPGRPEPSAVHPLDLKTGQSLARSGPGRGDQQQVLHHQNSDDRERAVGLQRFWAEKTAGDEQAQRPVDDQGDEPPAEPGDGSGTGFRAAKTFTGISRTGFGRGQRTLQP